LSLTAPEWLLVGLLAQAAFSARFLVQWVLSERARRSFLPAHFWFFSVVGSTLLLAYAAHQRDVVIALGQMVGLAIYLRNIELLQRAVRGRALSFVWPWLALAGAALAVGLIGHEAPVIKTATERAEPLWFALGLLGQCLFTGRFVVQLYASERAQASSNPKLFWHLSLSGSLLLLAYALHTGDAVIILGQCFGLIVYLRNLALFRRHRAVDRHGEDFEDEVVALREATRRASMD
jgi:lipid-A-disaccharide synthase-like uncharacterized protein